MGYSCGRVLRAFGGPGLFVLCAASGCAVSVVGPAGLTATVLPNGSYEIVAPDPDWRFAGSVGVPVSNLAPRAGIDKSGKLYNEISFDFRTDAMRRASIRAYSDTPVVLFSVTVPSGAPNTFSFPSFSAYPQGLQHIAFAGTFAFPTFHGVSDESPWIAFDPAMNSGILSPAAHFMVARTGQLASGELVSGISPKIAALPGNFTQQSILVLQNGINRTFETWGGFLTALNGKTRPSNDADLTLSSLGYWTDAGSSYYYSPEAGLTLPQTLSAIVAAFDQVGISLGYLQLDSWFYPKGPSADWLSRTGGIYEYLAASPPFTSSLASFRAEIGVPLVTHARWIDPASPYWSRYRMSGTVPTDPLYWDDVSRYLADSGVVAFEQDWLADKAVTAYNLTDADEFLDNMASAMGRRNLAIQYCSGTARHFLQSVKYGNVTTIRTSQDRCERPRWTHFLYASRLASALGVWPFSDVFMSYETGNLLLATLSAGPLGVGDRTDTLDAKNLRRSVRSDGVIVKPDVPVAPLDRSFWSDSQDEQAPMIAAASTDFGSTQAWYFFLYTQGPATSATFRLSDAGVTWPVFLYDYFQDTGRVVLPDEPLSEEVDDYKYLIATPVGNSGIALVGDTGHFVTLGKKRIRALWDDGVLHAEVAFAPSEISRTLTGYSPTKPRVIARMGSAHVQSFDPATGRFEITVTAAGNSASLEVRRTELRPARVRNSRGL